MVTKSGWNAQGGLEKEGKGDLARSELLAPLSPLRIAIVVRENENSCGGIQGIVQREIRKDSMKRNAFLIRLDFMLRLKTHEYTAQVKEKEGQDSYCSTKS